MPSRVVRRLVGWKAVLAFWIVGYFTLIPIWQRLQDGSYWLQVRSIQIQSVYPGEDPTMLVDRTLTLRRPTRGIWTAKLVNELNEAVCSNSRPALYTPKAELPSVERLRLFTWWMEGNRVGGAAGICNSWPLPPGRYCLETLWEFFPKNYPSSKHVEAPRACFRVLKPQ